MNHNEPNKKQKPGGCMELKGFTLRLSPEKRTWVELVARRRDCSLNDVIRSLVAEAIKKERRDKRL